MSSPYDPNSYVAGTQSAFPTAAITVGEVLPDAVGKNLDQPAGTVYVTYQIRSRAEKDGHRYMMGVASPNGFAGASVAFVQLAAPTLLWICDWTACRVGAVPEVPDPNSVIGDWVLLDDHWEPSQVGVAPDGVSCIYRLTGTFYYGHRNPNAVTIRNLTFPRTPWVDTSFDLSIPDSALTNNLIGPPGTSSAGGGTAGGFGLGFFTRP